MRAEEIVRQPYRQPRRVAQRHHLHRVQHRTLRRRDAELQVLIAENVPFVLLAYPDGAYVYNSDVYAAWEFIAGQGIVSKVSLLAPGDRP